MWRIGCQFSGKTDDDCKESQDQWFGNRFLEMTEHLELWLENCVKDYKDNVETSLEKIIKREYSDLSYNQDQIRSIIQDLGDRTRKQFFFIKFLIVITDIKPPRRIDYNLGVQEFKIGQWILTIQYRMLDNNNPFNIEVNHPSKTYSRVDITKMVDLAYKQHWYDTAYQELANLWGTVRDNLMEGHPMVQIITTAFFNGVRGGGFFQYAWNLGKGYIVVQPNRGYYVMINFLYDAIYDCDVSCYWLD